MNFTEKINKLKKEKKELGEMYKKEGKDMGKEYAELGKSVGEAFKNNARQNKD